MKLLVSPQASRDLEAIADYIAEHNPYAALKVVDVIEHGLQKLIAHPFSGMPREDIGAGIRHVVAGRYLALYRVADEAVVVLRVLHGRRRIDPDALG